MRTAIQALPVSGILLTRILQRIKVAESGCWEWTPKPRRYPQLNHKRRNHSAHRLMYRLVVGPVSSGMVVLHKCDNKCCVRPSHLEVGTQAQNIQDAWDRGLQPKRHRGGAAIN